MLFLKLFLIFTKIGTFNLPSRFILSWAATALEPR